MSISKMVSKTTVTFSQDKRLILYEWKSYCPDCGEISTITWDGLITDSDTGCVGPVFCPFCGSNREASETELKILKYKEIARGKGKP